MDKKKEKFFLRIFYIFGIIIILINMSSALGIGPGKIEFNFQPGFEQSITYGVYGADPETELELYVEGDLAEYVTLDKDKLIGGGVFTATLKLPEYIEKPGKHRILVGAKEKFDEELLGTAIGTSVNIRGVIDIHVPYPGKYLEITLSSHDVNVGEPVKFELDIVNKGKEDVSIKPKIEILSQNKTIETLYLKERFLKSQERIELKKILNTTNYNPGSYNAIAIVDYGEIAKAESKFRIGELVINIINYTRQITIDGLQSFSLEIESGWNDNIDGAYAEVFILNDPTNLLSFKTFSTGLIPWEKKNITGFFDTTNFTKGFYDANITLFYYGKNVGKSSSELVKIEFIEKSKQLLIWFVIGGILFVLIIMGFIIEKYFLKHGRKK